MGKARSDIFSARQISILPKPPNTGFLSALVFHCPAPCLEFRDAETQLPRDSFKKHSRLICNQNAE